ncbi:MAG: tetratricopeptide repeat protein [Aestuariivirga sp.]
MKSSQRALLVFALALGFSLAPLGAIWGAGTGATGTPTTSAPTTTAKPTMKPNAGSNFLKAKAKVDAGDYKGAVPILEKIVAEDSSNADAFNLLGFSNRKLGYMDKALGFYLTALKLNPNHVGAHEYLGELYLETNDLPKAQEQLVVLTKVCGDCKESADLAKLIAGFKAKNG